MAAAVSAVGGVILHCCNRVEFRGVSKVVWDFRGYLRRGVELKIVQLQMWILLNHNLLRSALMVLRFVLIQLGAGMDLLMLTDLLLSLCILLVLQLLEDLHLNLLLVHAAVPIEIQLRNLV